MGPARLEGHAPRLPAGVLDRVGDQEALPVEARQRLQEDSRTGLDRGRAPGAARRGARRDERVDRRGRIANPERLAVWRRLGADEALVRVPVKGKGLAEQRLEGGVAVGLGGLAVYLGGRGFRIRAEVGPLADRVDRAPEQRLRAGRRNPSSLPPSSLWTG